MSSRIRPWLVLFTLFVLVIQGASVAAGAYRVQNASKSHEPFMVVHAEHACPTLQPCEPGHTSHQTGCLACLMKCGGEILTKFGLGVCSIVAVHTPGGAIRIWNIEFITNVPLRPPRVWYA